MTQVSHKEHKWPLTQKVNKIVQTLWSGTGKEENCWDGQKVHLSFSITSYVHIFTLERRWKSCVAMEYISFISQNLYKSYYIAGSLLSS